MKKLALIALLFYSSQFYSQINKQKSTLFFKDGTQLKCYAKVTGDYIRYAENKKGKEKKVNYMDLEYLNLYIKKIDKLIYLYFKTEKGKDKPRLMELIVDGEVKLYRVLNIYKNSNLNFTKKKSSNTRYFLEKNDNSNTVFRVPKKFNIEMKEYFSDCNKLVKLIGLDGFRRKDIANIVLYYNEGCK